MANRIYSNIKTFSGGMKAWKAAGYRVEQSHPLPDYEIELIDAEHFKNNFRNCCVVDFKGKQAPLAASFLRNMGYGDVAVLKGGLISFER